MGIEQFKVIMALSAYVQRLSLSEDCLRTAPPFEKNKINQNKGKKKNNATTSNLDSGL